MRRLFWGHCGILLEAYADEKQSAVIEEAFKQHVRVCARPEMHYCYCYCRAAMWDYVGCLQGRQEMRREAVGGRRVRS